MEKLRFAVEKNKNTAHRTYNITSLSLRPGSYGTLWTSIRIMDIGLYSKIITVAVGNVVVAVVIPCAPEHRQDVAYNWLKPKNT